MFHKPMKSGLIGLTAFASSFMQAVLRFLVPVEGSIEFVVESVGFSVMMSKGSICQTIERATQRINLPISSIALTSLLVGGVVVMKIMLMTVVERTHAIGIGIAGGARRRGIFPIESGTACLLGGTLGICLTVPPGLDLDRITRVLQTVVPSNLTIASFDVSTIEEIISGIVPAAATVGLDPIEALVRE
jgi:macrolide transport system ATP-binding/permease protein